MDVECFTDNTLDVECVYLKHRCRESAQITQMALSERLQKVGYSHLDLMLDISSAFTSVPMEPLRLAAQECVHEPDRGLVSEHMAVCHFWRSVQVFRGVVRA